MVLHGGSRYSTTRGSWRLFGPGSSSLFEGPGRLLAPRCHISHAGDLTIRNARRATIQRQRSVANVGDTLSLHSRCEAGTFTYSKSRRTCIAAKPVQQSNTDQKISFRNRWSSRTSSRIASGSWPRCHWHSCRACLHHLDLARHPGVGVLGARRRPKREEMMIRVCEGSVPTRRHEARVADLRQDHRAPLSVSAVSIDYRFAPGGQYHRGCYDRQRPGRCADR
jgi:hypothetical protein